MIILDYKSEILSKLIEKYNKRDLKYSGKEINREISVRPKDFYRIYGTPDADASEEKRFNEAVESLIQHGFVEAKRVKFSDDITKIVINQENLNAVIQYLVDKYHIIPRNTKVSDALDLVHEYEGRGSLTDYYCEKLEKQVTSKMSDIDIDKEKKIFSILDFIQANETDYYVREVSMLVFGSSKVFEENPFYDNVCTLIREATGKNRDESTLNDDILKDFHIQNIDQEILIKGDVTISFSGYKLAIGNFVNGVAFPSSEIGRIDYIDVATNKLLTIENKTAFYRFNNDDYAVMYLGGYANRYQVEFLKKIHRYDPAVVFYHFGDIDMGGLFIHQHLCNSTRIHFKMLHMGIEELESPGNSHCLQVLTEADRERAESLLEIPEYRDIVGLMLKKNIKLEQEIICLNI